MAIQTRNKRSIEFSTASMSDLVFLLLIFFILISTIVSPNAVKLMLPSSTNRTLAPKKNVEIYINEENQFSFMKDKVLYENITEEQLLEFVKVGLEGIPEASIVLRPDKTVEIQQVITVIDIVNQVSEEQNTKHKVILATQAK